MNNCCEEKSTVTILSGEDRVIPLRAKTKKGDAFSLSGATEIEVKFDKADGTKLSKKLSLSEVTIVSAADGKFSVTLTAANTALLKVGDNQDFVAEVTKPAGLRKVFFERVLNVRSV